MTVRGLTRRTSLLLPFLLAACGGEARRTDFPALRYTYLPPFRLNVASIDIVQRFVPSGVRPDVSDLAPDPPVHALRRMAQDRLIAAGATNAAQFAIMDASLTRHGDVISGRMSVELSIVGGDGGRLGFARAEVSRQRSGGTDDMRATLYDFTKAMMDSMNVEFQYQLQRNLPQWLMSASAAPSPVQAQPLPLTPGEAPAPSPSSPTPDSPPQSSLAPQPLAPQPLAPQPLAPQPLAPPSLAPSSPAPGAAPMAPMPMPSDGR